MMRLAAVFIAAGLGVASSAGAVDRDGWDLVNAPVAAFSIPDLDGRALRSSALRGKIVVVDFWATWCAPCIQELPELAAYHEKVRPRKDIVFLSLNVTEEKDVVTKFVKEKRIAFPVYLADSLLGPFEVSTFPTKLVLDMRPSAGKVGVIRFRKEGPATVESIEARVAELLAGKN
jgi:thiol-disulfide isomerase/thioredoxin